MLPCADCCSRTCFSCVDAHVAAATKAKVWTPLIKCTFTNRGTAGTVSSRRGQESGAQQCAGATDRGVAAPYTAVTCLIRPLSSPLALLSFQADTFVWLQGPVKPTARPLNVGTIVNKAFKSTGPLNSGVYNDQQNDYSGFGVTTATFNNKNYFAGAPRRETLV